MGLFAGTKWDVPSRCDRCDMLEDACECPPRIEEKVLIPPENQTAILSVEKRKKGKQVSVVRGLPEDGNDLPHLLTTLQTACGAGGSIQEEQIEIQGKHLERIEKKLRELGFQVKRK